MLPLRVIACLTVKNEFIAQSESGITIREPSFEIEIFPWSGISHNVACIIPQLRKHITHLGRQKLIPYCVN